MAFRFQDRSAETQLPEFGGRYRRIVTAEKISVFKAFRR